MGNVKLDHGTWVVVADGAKFLLLRNDGDRDYMRLNVVSHEDSETPPARALSTDRAGRRYDATREMGGGVRAYGKSGLEETDWHRVAEERFAEKIAADLGRWAEAGRFGDLVVIADPRTLGALRAAAGAPLRSVIRSEIAKDLTNLPLAGIEASITAHDDG